MKTLSLMIFTALLSLGAFAQNFDKQANVAKTAYASGKLEDSRFALQQMLNEVDIVVGKEVLKLLPAKIETSASNAAHDNVSGATGFIGVLIHRDYGSADKTINVDLINNSPLITSLNAILSLPLIGAASDGNQKRIKVNGYKGLLQKQINSDTNKTSYELQLPFGSTLLTVKADNTTEAQILAYANAIPVTEIAKMLQ
ncbi:MAG: hypothetical protein JWN56_2408 [Sphingobacteriales bacterium]|nr:hypothetical protein [Sphingobacteriales bacterium]